jgi:hypothetical protein
MFEGGSLQPALAELLKIAAFEYETFQEFLTKKIVPEVQEPPRNFEHCSDLLVSLRPTIVGF